jgi:hypothetical protein
MDIIYYSFCIINIVFFVFTGFLDYKKRNPFFIVWVSILVTFLIPSIFDSAGDVVAINDHADVISLNWLQLIKAQTFAFGFCLVYIFFSSLIDKKINTHDKYNFKHIKKDELLLTNRVFYIAMLAFGMALGALVINHGFESLLTSSYGYYRESASPVIKMLSFYLIASSGGCVLMLIKHSKIKFFLLVICITFFYLVVNTRQLILPFIAPFFYYFSFKKISLARFSLILLSVPVGLIFFLFLQLLRYQGGLLSSLESVGTPEFNSLLLASLYDLKGESLIRYAYYYFIEHGHSTPGFMEALTYIRLLLLPLPSTYFGWIKPRDFDEVLYSTYYIHDHISEAGTLHTTLMGSSYMNFGWLGIFSSIFFAILSFTYKKLCAQSPPLRKSLLYGTCFLSFLMISRGSIYNSMAMLIISTIIIFLLTYRYKK